MRKLQKWVGVGTLLLCAATSSILFAQTPETSEPECPPAFKVCLTAEEAADPDLASAALGMPVLTIKEATETTKTIIRLREARDIARAERDIALGEVKRLKASRSKIGFTIGLCGVVELADGIPIGPGGCYGLHL